MTPRTHAAKLLKKILNGQSLNLLLAQEEPVEPLTRAYCYNILREYYNLSINLNNYLQKKLKPKDQDIYSILLMGFYEIIFNKKPHHAIVSESIKSILDLKKNWAKGLVNGVLRNLIRTTKLIINSETQYNHPNWLINKIKNYYPDSFESIFENNNSQSQMVLRVNNNLENYKILLKNNNINFTSCEFSKMGLILEKPIPSHQLPGYNSGQVSIQDQSPQLVIELLDLKPNLTILDACAAPGNKTAHILETENNLKNLTAIDIDKNRLQNLENNLDRLNLNCNIICSDVGDIKNWWDGNPFDRILLDAPCSATGVIKRNPDIKIHRKKEDIPNLVTIQFNLLSKLWKILKPNGILVYATCSILKEENQDHIKKFLENNLDAKESKINKNWGIPMDHGRQILPSDTMDGFYYCVLKKI